MFMPMSGQPFGVGSIKLSDGAVLRLRILIVDIKEMGFSPFGGVKLQRKRHGWCFRGVHPR